MQTLRRSWFAAAAAVQRDKGATHCGGKVDGDQARIDMSLAKVGARASMLEWPKS